MEFFENISLKKLNTFALDVKTKYFIEITDVREIQSLVESKIFRENKHFILGAGSNVLFTQDYERLIINMSNRE
jgi:UDP-N-acetylmuramate dehydrogenase